MAATATTYVVDVSYGMGQAAHTATKNFLELALRVAEVNRSRVEIVTFGASVHVALPLSGLIGVEVGLVEEYCAIDTTPSRGKLGVMLHAVNIVEHTYNHEKVSGKIVIVTNDGIIEQIADICEKYDYIHAVRCAHDPAAPKLAGRRRADATTGDLVDVIPLFEWLGASRDEVTAAARACDRCRWYIGPTIVNPKDQVEAVIQRTRSPAAAMAATTYVVDVSDSMGGVAHTAAKNYLELALRIADANKSLVSIITFGADVRIARHLSRVERGEDVVRVVECACTVGTTPSDYSKRDLMFRGIDIAWHIHKQMYVSGKIVVITDGRDFDWSDEESARCKMRTVWCAHDPAAPKLAGHMRADATTGDLVDVIPSFRELGASRGEVVAAARACVLRRWDFAGLPIDKLGDLEDAIDAILQQYAELIKDTLQLGQTPPPAPTQK